VFVRPGILAAHTILETARDAFFLARLPPSELPWMHLAMAAIAVTMSNWSTRRRRGPRALAILLAICSAGTFLFCAAGSPLRLVGAQGLYAPAHRSSRHVDRFRSHVTATLKPG